MQIRNILIVDGQFSRYADRTVLIHIDHLSACAGIFGSWVVFRPRQMGVFSTLDAFT